MIEKIFTLIWFLRRVRFWSHTAHLIYRKFLPNNDSHEKKMQATEWAAKHAVSYREALFCLNINIEDDALSDSILKEGEELAAKSPSKMGGPGDLKLLYHAVRSTKAKIIIETGVAYGWSSLVILYAISLNGCGTLTSIDMPYPKMGNENFVGVVVPERLKKKWSLIREPDRNGIVKAIQKVNGEIDLCHYDSDKSWWGRAYAYPLLWNALKPGGLFISDDIQDNMYFANFAKSKSLPFAVTKSDGKYVGLIRKQ